jgi:RNA polymerase sigma factor (sigma-70 family)
MVNSQGTAVLQRVRNLATAQSARQQSDLQLLQQFIAERDEAAFAVLVRRHGGMVLEVARGVLRHQQDAEDVFQAAFLVLARKAHTIRKQQALSSWLHGVAYRLALKAKNRSDRRRYRETPAADQIAASAADDLTLRELRVLVHEELSRLPEKYRAPLLLCYWEGKTQDEAANQLGVSAGSFKKCLERARNLLGSRLVGRGLVPSAAFFAVLFCENGLRAAASTSLTQSTARAAVAFAAGKAVSAGASAAAATLAKGAIRAMNFTKWATSIALMVLVGGLGIGLSLATYQALGGQQADTPGTKGGLVQVSQEGKGQARAKAGDRADKDRIVGTWRIAKGRADGNELPEEFTALARMTFTKDGKLILTMINEDKEGKYALVGPGKLDLALDTVKELGLGIYKFDGNDRLTICATHSTQTRPTEYTSEKGDGQLVFVLQRAKPGEEKLTAEEIAKAKGAVDKIKEAAARAQSANNLKQLGLAMHNYHDTNNEFPAHAIYDNDGKKPLLSWRVAILPYIGENDLYKEFKLDEPWDSAHNKKLIEKMPSIYEPVGAGKKGKGQTYYQVFTGPDTPFDGANKITLNGITDGTSNTVLAVEAKDPVPWTKPADLTMPKDKDKLPGLGGLFKSGMNVLFFDGSVRFMPRDVSAESFRKLVTPAGGEVVDD